MIKLFFIISATILCLGLQAKIEGEANCRYRTEDGWSKAYSFRIDLLSGLELSLSDPTGTVDSTKVYAGIWFSNDAVALVKLSELLGLAKFNNSSLQQAEMLARINDPLSPYLEGVDQQGKVWRIFFPIKSNLSKSNSTTGSVDQLISNSDVSVIAPTQDLKKEASLLLKKSQARLVKPRAADYIVVFLRSNADNPIIIHPKCYSDIEDQVKVQPNNSGSIMHVYLYQLTDFLDIRPAGHWTRLASE
jgi:hypothetical protein